MSEALLRIGYNNERILMEAARVLSPQFNQAVVHLTGAQVELLRNFVNYGARRSSFVDTYADSYYMMPDDDDWDDITAIVDDLMEVLMGNNNTIWGYLDKLITREDHTMIAPGSWVQNHDDVPEGEVWRVLGYSIWTSAGGSTVQVSALVPTVAIGISTSLTPAGGAYLPEFEIDYVLAEGDHVQMSWANVVIGQRLITNVWGYKMDIT